MKKLLVSVLVAAMVLSFGSMAFAAAGDIAPAAFNDIAGHEAEGALSLLAALGVFSGEQGIGGPVKPDDPLTRAQFAKVVVEAFGKGNMAKSLAGLRPNFSDEVPAWAWGYVNVAVYMGVINGYEDGTFRADRFVTYGEAITMLIRAVGGHKEQVGAGVWPYNFIFYGVDNGFNGPVDVSFASLPTTRGDMARMLLASMQVPKLSVAANGTVSEGAAYLDGRVFEGFVTAASSAGITLGAGEDAVGFTLADPVYLVGAESYQGLLGLSVQVVTTAKLTDGGKAFFVEVTEAAGAYTGVFASRVDTAIDADSDPDSLKFADGTVIAWAATDIVTLNQADSLSAVTGLLAGDQCTVFTNAAGKATSVVAFRYNIGEAVVKAADKAGPNTDLADITLEMGETDPTYDLPATARISLNGTGVNGDALAVNDVVKIATKGAAGTEVIAVSAVRQVVEGKVATTRTVYSAGGSANYATIGTTEYKVAAGVTPPSKDSIVKYALNAAGELFYNIAYTNAEPYVLLLGYTDSTSGDTVTVDLHGATTTYAAGIDLSGDIGKYGELVINTATNTVTGFNAMPIVNEASDVEYKVVAISGNTVTVQIYTGGTAGGYDIINAAEATIYRNDDGAKSYLGAEGLQVGMMLDCDATGIIFEYLVP